LTADCHFSQFIWTQHSR